MYSRIPVNSVHDVVLPAESPVGETLTVRRNLSRRRVVDESCIALAVTIRLECIGTLRDHWKRDGQERRPRLRSDSRRRCRSCSEKIFTDPKRKTAPSLRALVPEGP